MRKFAIILAATAIGATTPLAALAQQSNAPGQRMHEDGSKKGSPGASGYAPGQKMQNKGAKNDAPGASGYAPGRADQKTGTTTGSTNSRSAR